MLRNRNSHTRPVKSSHSRVDIGEMTSQLCQKTEKNCHLQDWVAENIMVSVLPSWITLSGQSQPRGHEDTQPAFWRRPHGVTLPTASTVHAHHVQRGRRSVPPAKPSDDCSHHRPWAQNLRPRPIPDSWPRDMVWDGKQLSFSLLHFGWPVDSNRFRFTSPWNTRQQHPQMAKRELQLPPHTTIRFTIYNLSTAGDHWTAFNHRALLPLPSKPPPNNLDQLKCPPGNTFSNLPWFPPIPTPNHGHWSVRACML